MPDSNEVALATKNFPHREEDKIVSSLVGYQVEGSLDGGSRFWGTLASVDEKWLYVRGHRDQPIMIKRSKISRLMAVD